MRVFYNRSNKNFGDHINSWIWDRLAPSIFESDDDRVLVGIGSLLQADLARVPGRKFIFGTGSGYGRPAGSNISRSWKVYAVRGPLTASLFGLDPKTAITDAAWLIDRLPEYQFRSRNGSKTIFIPHWTTAAMGDWESVCQLADLEYVDPLSEFSEIAESISSARTVITESLHGAIFADYYRVPWIPVSSATRVLAFKWVDWCQSLDLTYLPTYLPPSDFADFLFQGRKPSVEVGPYNGGVYPSNLNIGTAVVSEPKRTSVYMLKQRARKYARVAKNVAIAAASNHRGIYPISRWNASYQEKLAGYLEEVKRGERFLSGDRIRDLRLDQLNQAFDRFTLDQSL